MKYKLTVYKLNELITYGLFNSLAQPSVSNAMNPNQRSFLKNCEDFY